MPVRQTVSSASHGENASIDLCFWVASPIARKIDAIRETWSLLDATTVMNQSLPTVTETLPNVIHIELRENQSNDSSSPLTNTSREVKSSILEPVHSSNTSEQSTSQTPLTESLKNELNGTDPSSDMDITNEGVTNTASPPSLTTHEIFPPAISSPWLKGLLVNTKSLPELFKIIEKLNFNLTLSNRYLQELSQHYVKKLDETQQTTDLLLKASKAADAQVRITVRCWSSFHRDAF